MAEIPVTSTTLLRDISGDPEHARWGEFVARYRPIMEAYLREHFPSLEADDIVQETLLALVKALPNYTYTPDEKGYFHNYLTGIVRNKALKALDRRRREASMRERAKDEMPPVPSADDAEREAWRQSVYEIALQQYCADDSINERTRQVFIRLAVNGEKPEDVARAFGITRNAVDQMKSRSLGYLRKCIKALEDVDDARH